LPENFEVITPGIRFEGGATHDQKRVATPQEAISNGATLLVVGRIVTEASDPGEAAARISGIII
jgi:orotidine-5'-phosphate decarboxylase